MHIASIKSRTRGATNAADHNSKLHRAQSIKDESEISDDIANKYIFCICVDNAKHLVD